MRVLLVEDQSDAAQVLAKGLREHSYAVDIALDGEAALYQASINDYDLILLDVMLPRPIPVPEFQLIQITKGPLGLQQSAVIGRC